MLVPDYENTTFLVPLSSQVNVSSTEGNPTKCTFPLAHGIPIVLLNSIFSIFGTFGNVLIIVVVLKTRKLRRISNYLLLSLAVADLFVTTFAQPMQVTTVAVKTFGHFCVREVDYAYDVIANFSCSCSLYHLAAISIDRAIVIAKPHNYQSIMGKYGLRIMVGACWGMAIMFVSLRVPLPETLTLSIAIIFASYLIIIVSYSIILFQITRERVTRKMQPADSRGISRDARMERRVAGTIAIIIVVFSICWFPLVGFYVTMKKGLLRNLSGVPYMWIRTILLLNSSMNFLIYSFRIDHFRSAYKRIIRRWLKQSRAMGHGTTYSTPGTQSHSKQFSTMDKNAGEEV
ncbi:hypothetical protein QZH41_000378 [Actinostola sp. cb2023]|nr:hypothetical protein QZH41_000378 [Actinostola sp. cb2023]